MRLVWQRLALVGPVLVGPVLAVFLAAAPAGVAAQDFGQVVSPILIVDRERLFLESAYGKQIAALLEEERIRLETETRLIEADLEVEELALTEARPGLSNEEFRARANVFDARVQALRLERDAAQDRLINEIERARQAFLLQVNPILARLMLEQNAVILMDRRAVLLSAASVDITAVAIQRIDQTFGTETQTDTQTPDPADDSGTAPDDN